MDKREPFWRTWFLHKEVGFILSVLHTGHGKKPSFKRSRSSQRWGTMLTMAFSFSHGSDTRGWGSSLGRSPYMRDFICECALPNASPQAEAQQRGLQPLPIRFWFSSYTCFDTHKDNWNGKICEIPNLLHAHLKPNLSAHHASCREISQNLPLQLFAPKSLAGLLPLSWFHF